MIMAKLKTGQLFLCAMVSANETYANKIFLLV